jgi:hypothetical protein
MGLAAAPNFTASGFDAVGVKLAQFFEFRPQAMPQGARGTQFVEQRLGPLEIGVIKNASLKQLVPATRDFALS